MPRICMAINTTTQAIIITQVTDLRVHARQQRKDNGDNAGHAGMARLPAGRQITRICRVFEKRASSARTRSAWDSSASQTCFGYVVES